MTDAIRETLRGQLALLHSLANDTTEANWRDKRLYVLQTCVRMSDALAALDAEPEVRELTFVDRGLGIVYADSVVGTYKINGDGYWWRDDGSIEGRGGQAAVQADFERRIRSALVTEGA